MNPKDCRVMLAKPLPLDPIRTGYLLIDPCNLDEHSFREPIPMLHCAAAALTNSDGVMPRLIDVAALTPAQQDGLAEVLAEELRGERTPLVCAWLHCRLDAVALARHINRFLVGPGADGGDVLWRYYDPRVFALAVSLFYETQTEALLGPILEWHFPWCGHWWSVTGPGVEVAPLKGAMPAWPDASQWASLAHCAPLSAAMGQLQDRYGVLPAEACRDRLHEVDALMLAAKSRLHLSDKDDLIGYALMNVRYGTAFRDHPKLALAWDELAQGRIHWWDLTALLDQNDYRAMSEYAPLPSLSKGMM